MGVLFITGRQWYDARSARWLGAQIFHFSTISSNLFHPGSGVPASGLPGLLCSRSSRLRDLSLSAHPFHSRASPGLSCLAGCILSTESTLSSPITRSFQFPVVVYIKCKLARARNLARQREAAACPARTLAGARNAFRLSSDGDKFRKT